MTGRNESRKRPPDHLPERGVGALVVREGAGGELGKGVGTVVVPSGVSRGVEVRLGVGFGVGLFVIGLKDGENDGTREEILEADDSVGLALGAEETDDVGDLIGALIMVGDIDGAAGRISMAFTLGF